MPTVCLLEGPVGVGVADVVVLLLVGSVAGSVVLAFATGVEDVEDVAGADDEVELWPPSL